MNLYQLLRALPSDLPEPEIYGCDEDDVTVEWESASSDHRLTIYRKDKNTFHLGITIAFEPPIVFENVSIEEIVNQVRKYVNKGSIK